MIINFLEINVPSILTSTTRKMPCKGWSVHSPLLAHQVQRVDLEDLPGWRSCDVWMWCLYLVLCFPTGEVLVSGKDGGFAAVFLFLHWVNKTLVSLKGSLTSVQYQPSIIAIDWWKRGDILAPAERHNLLLDMKHHIAFHKPKWVPYSSMMAWTVHKTSYQLMVTLRLEDNLSPDLWRYSIWYQQKNAWTVHSQTCPCTFWVLDIPSRQVREGITPKTVLSPVSILTAMSRAGSSTPIP